MNQIKTIFVKILFKLPILLCCVHTLLKFSFTTSLFFQKYYSSIILQIFLEGAILKCQVNNIVMYLIQ